MQEVECPPGAECPLTLEVMVDPVLCADGHTYERFAIEQWLIVHKVSPKTNEVLDSTRLVPNHALRSMIQDWLKQHQEQRWHIPADRVILGARVVGRGAWGVVTESVMKDSQNRHVAVASKSVPDAVSDQAKKMLDRELKMLCIATSRCSGVCRFYGTVEKDDVMYLVMKLYEGSLAEQLDLAGRFPVAHSLDVFGQLCGAVAELHDAAVVNQDLKPSNVLYDRYGRYVLADFGLAALLEGSQTRFMPSSIQGTWSYMAPEQFDPEIFGGVTPKADVWGLGCILLEMITGEPPFPGVRMQVISRKVCDKKEHAEIPGWVPAEVRQLLELCFTYDPQDRPGAAEILENLNLIMEAEVTPEEAAADVVDRNIGAGLQGFSCATTASVNMTESTCSSGSMTESGSTVTPMVSIRNSSFVPGGGRASITRSAFIKLPVHEQRAVVARMRAEKAAETSTEAPAEAEAAEAAEAAQAKLTPDADLWSKWGLPRARWSHLVVVQTGESIAAAVLSAKEHTIIGVMPGVYCEMIEMKSKVALVAVSSDVVVQAPEGKPAVLCDGIRGAIIAGLSFKGGQEDCRVCVEIRDGSDVQMQQCIITAAPEWGVSVSGDGTEPLLRQCRIIENKGCGAVFYGGSEGQLVECEISQNGSWGVGISDEGTAPTLQLCRVNHNKDTGVSVYGGGGGRLLVCEVAQNGYRGVRITDKGSTPTLQLCRVHGNNFQGISVLSEAAGRLMHCQVEANGARDINIEEGCSTHVEAPAQKVQLELSKPSSQKKALQIMADQGPGQQEEALNQVFAVNE